MKVTVAYGRTELTVDVPDERLIAARRAEQIAPAGDPAAMVRAAITSPTRFPPMYLAFTPDDHVAVVADPGLPNLNEWLRPVLDELKRAGVEPHNVTVVFPPGGEAPLDLLGVRVEKHDPADETRRAYLATTAAGRRIYLNRTVVEADQLVVLAEVRYADREVTGGPAALFPALAETGAPCDEEEAEEVTWLLGLPFFIHAIAGAGGAPGLVIAGPPDTFADAKAALKSAWTERVTHRADIVVAGFNGGLDELLNALDHARRAATPDGRIVLLTDETPTLGPSFDIIADSDSPAVARKMIAARAPDDAALADRWLRAVAHHRVTVLSGWPDESVEDLFATPVQNAKQVQRLIDGGGDVLILTDAHRTRVGLEKDGSYD